MVYELSLLTKSDITKKQSLIEAGSMALWGYNFKLCSLEISI